MRSRTVLAVVIALGLVTVVLVASSILFRKVEHPVETLSTSGEGNIMILENGDALMELSTTVSAPSLAAFYRESYENSGENLFKMMFHDGVQREYKILTGIEVSVLDSEIGTGPNGEFKISVDATASQVARFNQAENLWEVDISPPEENDKEAAGFILTQMMFAQLMLKSLPGEHQLELVSNTPIRLPEDATIINSENLSTARWRIDFGGGTYREASISLGEGQREVVLTEKIVVTEQTLVELSGEIFRTLSDYKTFTIKYRLPGHSPTGSTVLSARGEKGTGGSNTDFSWNFGDTFSYTFSETFAGLIVDATSSFGLNWYVGWDFEWEKAGLTPSYKLQWFRTYVEVGPAIDIDFTFPTRVKLSVTLDKKICTWSRPVTVFFGWLLVVIDVKIDLVAGVEASAEAGLSIDAGANASATFKLGAEWIKDQGWKPIAERQFNFTPRGPNITQGAGASIIPFLELKVGAYFYRIAGPFVSLKPLVAAALTVTNFTPLRGNWSIEAGFDINAGATLGAIGDWLGLEDPEPMTLYSWRTPLASGTWPENSMHFKVEKSMLGQPFETVSYWIKNIGAPDVKMRIDFHLAEIGYYMKHILDFGENKAWIWSPTNHEGLWVEISAEMEQVFQPFQASCELYITRLKKGELILTDPTTGATIESIYDIQWNPDLPDDLFRPPPYSGGRIFISSDKEFTAANGVVSGSGTQADPYIIEGWAIDASDGIGIYILNTTKYFVIRNCMVKNGQNGIRLQNVINGKVINNTCSNNDEGIFLVGSSNNTLTTNTCESNQNGIELVYGSSNNTISNNTCESNQNGIWLSGSSNNTISNNTCSNNNEGIFIEYSSNNTLTTNTCCWNYSYGIRLYGSSNNTLSYNTCLNNVKWCIYLDYTSSYNTLTGNNVFPNRYKDDGTNNTWA